MERCVNFNQKLEFPFGINGRGRFLTHDPSYLASDFFNPRKELQRQVKKVNPNRDGGWFSPPWIKLLVPEVSHHRCVSNQPSAFGNHLLSMSSLIKKKLIVIGQVLVGRRRFYISSSPQFNIHYFNCLLRGLNPWQHLAQFQPLDLSTSRSRLQAFT